MNIFLIFFALPIATIIISIALQRILKCPALVAAVVFAIFLIVTFVINDLTFLIATIVYTIISFITAIIVKIICKYLREIRRISDNNQENCCNRERNEICCYDCRNNNTNELFTISSNCNNFENGDLLTISSNGCNGTTNELLTINSNQNNNFGCNCSNRARNGEGNNNCCSYLENRVNAKINIVPNNSRTGQFYGCYRRRA